MAEHSANSILSDGACNDQETERYSDPIDREARRRLMELDDAREDDDNVDAPEPKTGCCSCCSCLAIALYCQLWSKADKLLMAMCLSVAAMSGGVTALFLCDHFENHGKCILAANYRVGSMEYSTENIWCATSMYFHVISIGLAIGLVFVNWIAQLNNNLCWQKFQALVALLGCGGALLSGITLLYGYVRWCGQLVDVTKCSSFDQGSSACKEKVTGCLSAAEAYDKNPGADEKMRVVFFYALGESLAVWSAAVLWLILTGTAVRKLMDGIRQEQRKQKEAQTMFFQNQPGSGGYQQSAPGEPQC